ncbi:MULTISPECIES: DUF4290 domain-containing protein [Segatella]|jgi:hypothetical protein|uniref:Uncharacterized protein n=2 Tax=Segatella TaxID=2974251 RepID=D8DTG8_9BACT|nr:MULTISPECIES: DUF4290 domain-containing protein [Segatella]MBQ3857471.1 DUF4290 domain-containing protein [Prevotella sp.]EFI73268.1 conserved hypothetical protein [Segatella baroniae B14]MDR4930216.1 DUF4290 domain-containing protein [Segatella bryantii]OYP55871.1 DUF4290 domain-containing protein [Segatella bryantii]UKK76455.1 DUF4290 domain-containing protein [Segatella bryantii]
MNIEGLDYNTQRERLVLPEYGREIQNMVNYCLTLTDRQERQNCAESIVDIMERMIPQNHTDEDYKQKLWDHLAIMSNFQLDIDYPYDVSQAARIATKPEPMEYPEDRNPVRHYGKMLFEIFEQLKTMEPGEERDELIRITANQMKRNLVQWSHGSCDDEKVADDLARYTDGKVQLDLDHFTFDKITERENVSNKKKKK